MTVFMIAPTDIATGLEVRLPPFPCHDEASDRIIVLRITNAGELFINMEALPWAHLSDRLAEIYRMRASREIDLYSEDEVPFQAVANAIDIARNSPRPGPDSLDIKVVLVTPKASRECIPIPVRIIHIKQALR
jgi:biopolymer transport protein ExbD